MTLQQAARLAMEAMRAEVKRLAVDANLCDRLGLKEPGTLRASKRRRRLLAAIATLSTVCSGENRRLDGEKTVR